MASRSLRLTFVGLLAALSVGGCAYDDGYGYGGMSVGTGHYAGNYGPGGYYDPSYYGGWYNDFYYPGTGYYVIDRGGRRHRWNDNQRSYWEARRQQYRGRQQAGRPDARPGRGTYRRPDRAVEGQPGRNFEGRRQWRRDGRPDMGANPADRAQAPRAVPADRPALRERWRGGDAGAAARAARPEGGARAGGWRGSPRSNGRQQRPQ
ncbi:MAG: peptidase [Sphingobium sp.]|uniref:peptidase n=1 Tax=Sphingobium sp. TaxID=1912891 RepID=UPI0029BEAEBE|nr:peptidase [Sphingobium sp.]MDX3910049.1 peptidase [Sphingobium sp.]